jgi:hypothetical protein
MEVLIFCYNRSFGLSRLLDSIRKSQNSNACQYHFYIDGKRSESDSLEQDKITREINSFINEGYSSRVVMREYNYGLSRNIISGVTEVFEFSNQLIVLEDDLIVGKYFFNFMSKSLDYYKDCSQIFSINGFSLDVSNLDLNEEVYVSPRFFSWGWATWKSRWTLIDWDLENWSEVLSTKNDFDRTCGSDCYKMLNRWRNGKNDSWAIRFAFQQFRSAGFSLTPKFSLIMNVGFDNSGENCKQWNRFKSDFREYYDPDPALLKISDNAGIFEYLRSYHTITYRIYVRVRYYLGL